MKSIKVSAIITTHNRLELLKRAISSVFDQTYNDLECIVVSDASNDGTDEYCSNLPIKFIKISKADSRGGNYARNLGILASEGDYIAFLDDDDYWKPEKIKKQVELIEEKKCEMVHCGRTNEVVKPNGITYIDRLPLKTQQGDLHKKILTNICTTTTCMLVKRKALMEIGMFDEKLKFWQEYDLTIRLAQRSPIYYVNEPLCVYRIDKSDPNRLTNKYTEWLNAVDYVYEKYKDLYKSLNWLDKNRAKLLFWRDAAVRCKAAGFVFKYYRYGIQYKVGKIFFDLFGQ